MMTGSPLEQALLAVAADRGPMKTYCPSEVARLLWPDDWEAHMDEVRAAAFDLVAQGGQLEVRQGVTRVDRPGKGPIRLALAR